MLTQNSSIVLLIIIQEVLYKEVGRNVTVLPSQRVISMLLVG